ncbi:hypothetical protein H5410_062322 [Solanum commersonii]|uniref:Uncharacterized protein n=1 Tax=Solanum commersonii TaxID=4109 RepID=A0A9J5WB95_SOLCO|nr:hypothetical protein H5410_062322 [Solanum commersonii]
MTCKAIIRSASDINGKVQRQASSKGEGKVENKTNSVIYPWVITKRVVATFMGNDPYSSANTTLSDPSLKF